MLVNAVQSKLNALGAQKEEFEKLFDKIKNKVTFFLFLYINTHYMV